MIDTTNLNDRQFADLLMQIINEINTIDTELQRIKAELQHIKKSEVL